MRAYIGDLTPRRLRVAERVTRRLEAGVIALPAAACAAATSSATDSLALVRLSQNF